MRRRHLMGATGAAVLSRGLGAEPLALPLDTGTGLEPLHVDLSRGEHLGRPALRVRLTEARQRLILTGGTANGPTMALLPGEFGDGTIEVDIAAAPNGLGAPDSRGFAGLAFRVAPAGERFEAIYLRMTNGSLAVPPPPAPRDVRAVQYVAHPVFHFDQSRREAPGRYEAAAPVAPDRWFRFRLDVRGGTAEAFVDGTRVLAVDRLRLGEGQRGRIGLWVDDGTDGWFRDLRVAPA